MTLRQAARIAVVIVLLGGMGVGVLFVVLDRQDRNSGAIRVNCVLLANAIVQSGSGPVARDTARARLARLYTRAARRNLTVRERMLEHELLLRVKREGALLTVPDCDMVAEHPESVRAIQLKPTG